MLADACTLLRHATCIFSCLLSYLSTLYTLPFPPLLSLSRPPNSFLYLSISPLPRLSLTLWLFLASPPCPTPQTHKLPSLSLLLSASYRGEGDETGTDVGKDVCVTDQGDGTYTCTYSVVEGTADQSALLEVLSVAVPVAVCVALFFAVCVAVCCAIKTRLRAQLMSTRCSRSCELQWALQCALQCVL